MSRHSSFHFQAFLFNLCRDVTSSCCDQELYFEFFIHCRDIVRNVATFFLLLFSTYVATKINIIAGWTVCCNIEILVATNLSWLVSFLFHFLSRHKTFLSRQKSLNQQLLLSQYNILLSRQRFLPSVLYYVVI